MTPARLWKSFNLQVTFVRALLGISCT